MKARNNTMPAWKASTPSPAAAAPLMTDWELVKLMLDSGGRPKKNASFCEAMPTRAPSGIHVGGLHDDDLVDWLSSPIDDYCSELLSDISGAEATAVDAPPNESARHPSPSKGVINFSIFSRALMESSAVEKPHAPSTSACPLSEQDSLAVKKGLETQASSEKIPESPIASSSLCSNNDPKRRRREEDDGVDYQTEENGEGESTNRRHAGKGRLMNKKRSRSSEVHNLSERRRRDRINEKMRALQELVPCCNKQVDKASMLDEVIEYLKSLQMQVQAMSMGYMRPMMLPNGMPMNMNMNMNMGMGMVDMGGFPLMSYPSMNGHPNGVPMMMPGHVMPMSMLRPPQFIPMGPSPPSAPSSMSKAMRASEQ
ncbi:uncharacterized protein LOC144715561 isoform X1 [Wolffia australiana]